MVSKITFLGTAGDCFVYSKQLRSTGGMVIKTGGYQFFVDPGPGALVRAKQCNVHLRETTAVVATHSHTNHSADLNPIIAGMSYNGLDRIGVVIANTSVTQGLDGKNPIISDFHSNCVERIITLKEGQKVGIENIEIHALKAHHDDPEAIGVKFFTPDFVMVYTGDTAFNKDLIDFYKPCDIMVLNVVHTGTEKSDNNLSSEDAIKLITQVKPQLAIITHFGKSMLQADPLMEARRIQKETGVQVIAATDGMVISPNYYSAEMKQKTLNLYKKPETEEERLKEKSEDSTEDGPKDNVEPEASEANPENPSQDIEEDNPKEKQQFLIDS